MDLEKVSGEFKAILNKLSKETQESLLDSIVSFAIGAGIDETTVCPEMNLICFNAFGDKE